MPRLAPARTPPEQVHDIPAMHEGEPRCTTPRQKAHGTGPGHEERVAYTWHPWFGRAVRVREVVRKQSIVVVRCSPVDDQAALVPDVPAWMLDESICRTMRASPEPVPALSALLGLQLLLSMSAAAAVESALDFPDRPRGNRHGSSASPEIAGGLSARSLSADGVSSGPLPARMDVASACKPKCSNEPASPHPDRSRVGGQRRRRGDVKERR